MHFCTELSDLIMIECREWVVNNEAGMKMKTLYLDCNMGIAGDMFLAALLELTDLPERWVADLNALGIPQVRIRAGREIKSGISGTKVRVMIGGQEELSEDDPGGDADLHHDQAHHDDQLHSSHHHHDHHRHHDHHHHAGLQDIQAMISGLKGLPEAARSDALEVFGYLAEAESQVHGVPVDQIHFHEVGNLDAVADIVSVCWLMRSLAVEQVISSPIHVGSGQVRCAHGILPVPAPATALLLQGMPMYGGQIRGELCTPTGAALLKKYVQGFGGIPQMRLLKTGYGLGTKDFEIPNLLRVMLGEADEPDSETESTTDRVYEMRCNLDDMTAEDIAFVQELLLEHGALEVYTLPCGMKKGRPGVVLNCLCRSEQKDSLIQLMLTHTTTLGVRFVLMDRYVLARTIDTVETPFGPVRVKQALGRGIIKEKPEFDDLARIAREKNLPLESVRKGIRGSAVQKD